MALKLGFVLFLIYGCAYLLRRYSASGVGEYNKENAFPNFYTRLFGGSPDSTAHKPSQQQHEAIRIIHTRRLRPQLYLQLIEVENQRLLLSVSNEGVTLIQTFPVKEISDETSA